MTSATLATALGVLVPIWENENLWAGNPDEPLAVSVLPELEDAWRRAKRGPIPSDLRWAVCLAVSVDELASLLAMRGRWLATVWLADNSSLPLAISSFERVVAGTLPAPPPAAEELTWSWLASLSQQEARVLLTRRQAA